MKQKYSLKEVKENTARALGKDMPISFKYAIEVCNYIRNNTIAKAKTKLEDAINMKRPIPFKRFTNGVGHKKGDLASGRFAVKASYNILNLLKSAESNALFKGLSSKDLVIVHLSAKKSPSSRRYGRRFGRVAKSCHVEIILEQPKQAERPKSDKQISTERPNPTKSKIAQPTEKPKANVKIEEKAKKEVSVESAKPNKNSQNTADKEKQK